jgi:hypothetical protein
MRTDHLFELWCLDPERLSRAARTQLGDCDIFLGGSLVDDLGGTASDVDLYCFLPPGRVRPAHGAIAIGTTLVELHAVRVDDYVAYPHSLVRLLSESAAPGGLDLPLPSNGDLRLMHALWRDHGLARGELAESVRVATGADLLHLYVMVRALSSAASLVHDAINHLDAGDGWAALHCARLAAEAGCDAVLASTGVYNPNPKWRISLLHRARLGKLAGREDLRLLDALFPRPEPTPQQAATGCVSALRTSLELVRTYPLVSAFPAVAELEKGLASWTDTGCGDDA